MTVNKVATAPEHPCPECGHPMSKAGSARSGRRLVQNYVCSKCGRKHMDSGEPFVRMDDRSVSQL